MDKLQVQQDVNFDSKSHLYVIRPRKQVNVETKLEPGDICLAILPANIGLLQVNVKK